MAARVLVKLDFIGGVFEVSLPAGVPYGGFCACLQVAQVLTAR